jgi:hypothetical protein
MHSPQGWVASDLQVQHKPLELPGIISRQLLRLTFLTSLTSEDQSRFLEAILEFHQESFAEAL